MRIFKFRKAVFKTAFYFSNTNYSIMKSTQVQINYIKWLKPGEMHKEHQEWLSELGFVNNEQRFFEKLLKSYSLQLIDSRHFEASKDIITNLRSIRKDTKNIMEMIKVHGDELEIMVDDIDQPKAEGTYRKEHLRLTIAVAEFLEKYKKLKMKFFKLIKEIIKEKKQKYLA